MRRPELGFAARETAPGLYKFQVVIHVSARNGVGMMKTFEPHAQMLDEARAAKLGYATDLLIGRAQQLRATKSEGEAAKRRRAIEQVTLSEIDARGQARLQRDLAELDEEINAVSRSIAFSGDPDELFHTNYPNVVDQYRDFDYDPDRRRLTHNS